MTDTIRAGTMFLAEGTSLPESLVVDTEPYTTGWSRVPSSSTQLGSKLESVGWTFFCRTGSLHTHGFGFHEQSRTNRAVAHAMEAVKREQGNCLEITHIRQRSFLGLRYTSLVAYARQIQRSPSFPEESDLPARLRSPTREWVNEQARPVRRPPLSRGEAVQAWENEGGSRAEV